MKLSMPGTPKSAPGPGPPPDALSPGWLQPGPSRMVGAGAFALTPLPGNQWAAILVPSKELTVTSFAPASAGTTKAGPDDRGHGQQPPKDSPPHGARQYQRAGGSAPVPTLRAAARQPP